MKKDYFDVPEKTSITRVYDIPASETACLSDDYKGGVKIDFSKITPGARPGLPWSAGQLYLEHKAELRIYGRGLGSRLGEYWKLRAMPQVQSSLQGLKTAILDSPLLIQDTALPPWLADNKEAGKALEVQKAFIERVWWKWTRAGIEHGLDQWIEHVLLFAPVCGFYLGEMVGTTTKWDLGQGEREYICPSMPELRAPWTIREWLLAEGEKPKGVTQILYHSTDNQGIASSQLGQEFTSPSQTEVAIPWERLIHIPFDPAGPTDLEGRSFLRGAEVPLKILQDCWQLQALSIEVNGLGTWVVSKSDPAAPGMTEDERDKLETHLQNYKGSHIPYVIMPGGYSLDLIAPQSAVPDLSSQIGIYEHMVEVALNQAHKGIASRGVGSYAARSDASTDARSEYDVLIKQLICHPLERLLGTFLAQNFPEWAERDWIFTPQITNQPADRRDFYQDANAISSLTGAGHISPHTDITRALLERFELPSDFVDQQDGESEGVPGSQVGSYTMAESSPENEADLVDTLEAVLDDILTQRLGEMTVTAAEQTTPWGDEISESVVTAMGERLEGLVDERIADLTKIYEANNDPQEYARAVLLAGWDNQKIVADSFNEVLTAVDTPIPDGLAQTLIEAGVKSIQATQEAFEADVVEEWETAQK
jgi:hypothetical protein